MWGSMGEVCKSVWGECGGCRVVRKVCWDVWRRVWGSPHYSTPLPTPSTLTRYLSPHSPDPSLHTFPHSPHTSPHSLTLPLTPHSFPYTLPHIPPHPSPTVTSPSPHLPQHFFTTPTPPPTLPYTPHTLSFTPY